MKKIIKIAILVVTIIFSIMIIDYITIKCLKRPLLAKEVSLLNSNNHKYIGLYYDAYYCSFDNKLYVTKKHKTFKCIDEKDENSFLIINNSKTCSREKKILYTDSDYVYYGKCLDGNNTFIKFFSKDEKYSLNYVLNNKLLTINELIDGGLRVYKEERAE